jgi:hypothetical protein
MKRFLFILALVPLSGCSFMSRATGDKSLEDFFVTGDGQSAPAAVLIEKSLECAVEHDCMNPVQAATVRNNLRAKQDLIRARRGAKLEGE